MQINPSVARYWGGGGREEVGGSGDEGGARESVAGSLTAERELMESVTVTRSASDIQVSHTALACTLTLTQLSDRREL